MCIFLGASISLYNLSYDRVIACTVTKELGPQLIEKDSV